MAEFYTLDRTGNCKTGGTFELLPPRYSLSYALAQDKQTNSEIEETMKQLFPGGLSPHGQRYVFEKYFYGQGTIAISPVVELFWEFVRRAEFPERPSRFMSFFGTENIDDARRFRNEMGQPYHRIFKVTCDHSFRADMRFLMLGGSGASAINLARKYWRGDGSATPLWEILLIPPVTVLEQVEP